MKMQKVVFAIPMYNAAKHLNDLISSLKDQTNENWEAIIVNDMSDDNSIETFNTYTSGDSRFSLINNTEKKWALKNVVEVARKYENEEGIIIANLDADDCLCNENTVELLIKNYDEETDTLWTGHSWDINGLNISQRMPTPNGINLDPYQFPWCSSHLKTFRSTLLRDISDKNFKDLDGNWFKRGYDQALYLPLLHKSRKRKYLDEICYLYRINSSSIKTREWSEKEQLSTVTLVRSRGFIE